MFLNGQRTDAQCLPACLIVSSTGDQHRQLELSWCKNVFQSLGGRAHGITAFASFEFGLSSPALSIAVTT
jgi:hypothetical protein